ncbi:MAG: PEGA domain-containing protein [Gammaproteobacteria bacterium]|nr:PEGA domain-containing protein [Gammaproteobacteria bacterium]
MPHISRLSNLGAKLTARKLTVVTIIIAVALWVSPVASTWAGSSNDVLGEVQLKAVSKTEKTAGIWVDGQYLGYLKELKGSKKILLLPGRHEIKAHLSGHLDFDTTVDLEAGEKKVLRIAMRENPDAHLPDPHDMARVKVLVKPTRAAVFVNEKFVGNVDQFRGIGDFLGLNPGSYRIHITLPGYVPFETEMTLAKAQKYEIKTKLQKSSVDSDDALLTRKNVTPAPEPIAKAEK